ncbi:hypothetical protein Syun_025551 [Stephania yunnanensis]|uniref:Uncharacterized protein n=1 Tax=Stephania yunnanensis TaxID=152371 RepID=A0AAP0HVW2_9MAGN
MDSGAVRHGCCATRWCSYAQAAGEPAASSGGAQGTVAALQGGWWLNRERPAAADLAAAGGSGEGGDGGAGEGSGGATVALATAR